MELDLTRLIHISAIGKEARKTPAKPILDDIASITTNETEKPAESQTRGLEGYGALKKEAERNREALARSTAISKEYLENTRRSTQLQAEILKGMAAGEDIYGLFLKACKAISLMTTNSVFSTQAEADIIAIYGHGLHEKQPLRIELQDVQKRLERLREAFNRETEKDAKERIKRAIKAHEAKIEELENLAQQKTA